MDFALYFQEKNLRKVPKEGIHFEQKTTPDLLWCVAQVVLDVTKDDNEYEFTDKEDIRKSELFNELMQDYFSKAPQSEAEDEYNKVSSYQLGLMTFAGILKEVSSRPKKYKIVHRNSLVYMAQNDLYASKFLTEYTEKFVKDNGLWTSFERYLLKPTQQNYVQCKEDYWVWARRNTDVRTNNPQHSFRVYNKIFNVLCYKHHVGGQSGSIVTEGPCPYSFLIYNRENFRDKDKPTGMTRQAYAEIILSDINHEGVVATLLKKAKESVARKYGDSEITDPELGYLPDNGVHVHHILPISYNAQFSLVRENLIALTPGQHLSYAHIKGNTQIISPKYQAICLLKKFENIIASIEANENFYSYVSFIDVVNACYEWNLSRDINSDDLAVMLSEKLESLA